VNCAAMSAFRHSAYGNRSFKIGVASRLSGMIAWKALVAGAALSGFAAMPAQSAQSVS
jgi:hypothetical protein